MDAVDPILGSDYVEDEMDRVLRVGMVCCSEEVKVRVNMRQVVQILEGQSSMGDLVPFTSGTEQESRVNDDTCKFMSGEDCAASWSLEGR